MSFHPRSAKGYSLVEVLMVMAIFAVLAVVGVSMIGNRQAAAVRSLLDELEGALTNARSEAAASSRDVAIETWGTWTTTTPTVLAFGDASLIPSTTGMTTTTDRLQPTALNLLNSLPADPLIPYSQSVVVAFHFLGSDVSQSRARISLANSGDWTIAGTGNLDITTLAPFTNGGEWNGVLNDANNLFLAGGALNTKLINGIGQRFASTFIIEVVGTSPNNGPMPGSPMGLIVVLKNSGAIYKFYNPGTREGNGQWRRI